MDALRTSPTTTSDVLITAVEWGFLTKTGSLYTGTEVLKTLCSESDTNKVILRAILDAKTPHAAFLKLLMKSNTEGRPFSKGEFLAEGQTNQVAFDICRGLFCDDMRLASCSGTQVSISEYGRNLLSLLVLRLFWDRVKAYYLRLRDIRGDRNVLLEDVYSEFAKEEGMSEEDFLMTIQRSVDVPAGIVLTPDPSYRKFGGMKYIAID